MQTWDSLLVAVMLSLAWTEAACAGGGDRSAARAGNTRQPRLVEQLGHTHPVHSVAFSPDGRLVLTGSSDGTAVLWDAVTGKELRRFQGHSNYVNSVAFSPDGRTVLTGGSDGTARLWDTATGVEKRTLGMPREQVFAVAFAPDGKLVLTGDSASVARLWDPGRGIELRRFIGSTDFVSAVAFSPDGRQVAAGGLDRVVHIWDAATGRELHRLQGHTERIEAVAFSPDGRLLVTTSWDKTARVWDATTGEMVYRFTGHAGPVHTVAFAPDGRSVLTGSKDQTVRRWEPRTGKELRPPLAGTDEVQAAAFSPDGRLIVTASAYSRVELWDAAGGRRLHTFREHTWPVLAVAFSPDGRLIATGGWGDAARLWDPATGQEPRRLRVALDTVPALAFSPDGKLLVTGSWGVFGGIPRIWDPATGEVVRAFPGHTDEQVEAVAFSPDGRQLLTGSADKTARLWDVATGKEIRRFEGHTARVRSVAFAPDGGSVLTGAWDYTSRLWDPATGKEIRRFPDPSWVESVAFAPDGRSVLTGDRDRIARLLETATGKELQSFRGHSDAIRAVAFSPDGRLVATGGWDRTARLWEVATGKELQRLEWHASTVEAVAFSPDGRWLLTGSTDGTAQLWDVTAKYELCRLVSSGEGTVVATPDHYYMASRDALENVAFGTGNQALPFEQFDLKFNRPDKVLARLGRAPRGLIDAYHSAYQKRLRKMHFKEEMLGDNFHVPEAAILSDVRLSTPQKAMKLRVRVADPEELLDRLQVYVNGVPLSGAAGIDLRGQKTHAWEQDVDLELSFGDNTIEVSALNAHGAESLRQTATVTCTAPPTRPDLYVVVVGVSDYRDGRYRLTYADKDAEDLAAFWRTREGQAFAHVHVRPILNRDATRENILRASAFLKPSKVDDEVVLFLAGHGLLDAKLDYYFGTWDVDVRDPAKRGLSYEAVEGLLDGIPARRKLLLMDTCHSGELDREAVEVVRKPDADTMPEGRVTARSFRGLEVVPLALPDSRQVLQYTFADLRRSTGAVVIAAAGGAEYALEAGRWHNGVFTYSVLDVLRKHEGKLRVSELRRDVFEEVRRLTRGRQTPASRRENLEYDFTLD